MSRGGYRRPTELPKMMTEPELAAYLGCSREKLAYARRAGNGIPYLKLGRLVRYRKTDVREFIEKNIIYPWEKERKKS